MKLRLHQAATWRCQCGVVIVVSMERGLSSLRPQWEAEAREGRPIYALLSDKQQRHRCIDSK